MNLTNSKYISENTGRGEANVSNWEVVLKYNGTTITNTYNIDLNSTLSTGKVVPGKEGSFPITIDATGCNTSLPIKYEIKISKDSSVPDNISFWITNDTTTILTNKSYSGTTQGGSTSQETINWKWNLTDVDEDVYQDSNFSLILEVTVYSN